MWMDVHRCARKRKRSSVKYVEQGFMSLLTEARLAAFLPNLMTFRSALDKAMDCIEIDSPERSVVKRLGLTAINLLAGSFSFSSRSRSSSTAAERVLKSVAAIRRAKAAFA
jgi:hypothetical protein